MLHYYKVLAVTPFGNQVVEIDRSQLPIESIKAIHRFVLFEYTMIETDNELYMILRHSVARRMIATN